MFLPSAWLSDYAAVLLVKRDWGRVARFGMSYLAESCLHGCEQTDRFVYLGRTICVDGEKVDREITSGIYRAWKIGMAP